MLKVNPHIQVCEDKPQKTFVLCRNICSIKDYSLQKIFVDIEGRILATEEDVFKVFNKDYSYQTFLYTQKPLFMEQAKKLRKTYI